MARNNKRSSFTGINTTHTFLNGKYYEYVMVTLPAGSIIPPNIAIDAFFKDWQQDRICLECGTGTQRNPETGLNLNQLEDYMVKDELWEQAVPKKKGRLHLRCLEKRLGRQLKVDDFPAHVPANHLIRFGYQLNKRR